MSLIVQKFGGSSVANTERLQNVADIVTSTYKAGNKVVVVVSAQGDTTDEFIEKAAAINAAPSKREMDVLLSAGEQISMALLAMAIEKLGCPVVSLTGWQAGIETNRNYSDARIRRVTGERIRSELDRGRIVIVAGFQGINKSEDITTLGRGGSDTTAVAIAASLRADLCQIYTDVDGVYTADPRMVEGARKLEEITYDEMLELATLGAQVLHNRSVEMAKKYNVDLEVVSSFTRNPGTKVKEVSTMEKMIVNGVARDNKCARVAVINLPDEPGFAFKVFSILAKNKINVDIILQSVGRNGLKTISFTVAQDDADRTKEVLEANKDLLRFEAISVNTKVAKVSIVGAGMQSNPGVAATMFEALAEAQINIRMISTSEIKISVLINEEDSERAVRAIHNKFFND
ncbi:MAG: aspartate kinase [Butyricicoccus sp.]|nr:aspartate kinase [Butyricicoccus sp.]